MINLIPAAAKKGLIKEYWVRTVTVWFYLWSVSILLGVFILIPSYVLINSQVSAYKDSAESASKKIANYENVSKELERSGKLATMMNENFAAEDISGYIALFRNLEQDGITISAISISHGEKGIDPIKVAGFADNRQALAAFRDRVVAEATVSSVDLPISNLAKDKDIPFEITVIIGKKKSP